MMAGIGGAGFSPVFAKSVRARNKGGGAEAATASAAGGDAASPIAGLGGELSCAAGGGASASCGGSIRCGGASIACSRGEGSFAPLLWEGTADPGTCHWNASSLPETGDTG